MAWLALKCLQILPRPVARWVAANVAALLFRIWPVWGKVAMFNLGLAFPDWTDAERRRVVKQMVRNFGWMAAEFARFPVYTRENIESAVVLDGFENFAEAERRGKGVLFLTGHFGAWELKPFAHALFHRPLYFLARPIDNPRVNELVNRYRGLSGNQPISKNESARAVLRVLRDGGAVEDRRGHRNLRSGRCRCGYAVRHRRPATTKRSTDKGRGAWLVRRHHLSVC